MPCVARFGFTKAVRYLPMLIMLVVTLGILGTVHLFDLSDANALAASPLGSAIAAVNSWFAADPHGSVVLCSVAVIAAAVVIYLVLCLLASRLYRTREF